MKPNSSIKTVLIGTMLFSALVVIYGSARNSYEILATLVWTTVCVWNIYAFFSNRDMMPSQFIELKKNGNLSGRSFVFWVTLILYFGGLLGIFFETRG